MVPHASVREFLLNKDINEKRVRWIIKAMEYGIEIRITKLVREKGLCKKMISSYEMSEEAALLIQDEKPTKNENQNDWLHDMITFLVEGRYSQGLNRDKRR